MSTEFLETYFLFSLKICINNVKHFHWMIEDMFVPLFQICLMFKSTFGYMFTPSLKTSLHDAQMHYVMLENIMFEGMYTICVKTFSYTFECISSHLKLHHIFCVCNNFRHKPLKIILKCAWHILNLHKLTHLCTNFVLVLCPALSERALDQYVKMCICVSPLSRPLIGWK